MPGRNLWTPEADSFRDRRVPNFDTVDPNIKPMSQDAFNARHRVSAQGQHDADASTTRTATCAGRSRISACSRTATRSTSTSTPAKASPTTMVPSGLTAEFATPKPKRQYDALEAVAGRSASRTTGSAAPATSTAGSTATTRVWPTPTRSRRRRPTAAPATAQQQAGSIARPGSSANRAWDLDELVWDSHGNLDVLGRLATDRPHVVKLYGSYMLPTQHAGGRVLLRRQRHAGQPDRLQPQRHPGLRGRPRQHGPDAVPDADRPAGVARPQVRRRPSGCGSRRTC